MRGRMQNDAGGTAARAPGWELFSQLCLIYKNTFVGQNLHNCSTYHAITEKVSGTPPSERTVVKATEARVQRERVTGLERQLGREWLR